MHLFVASLALIIVVIWLLDATRISIVDSYIFGTRILCADVCADPLLLNKFLGQHINESALYW